MERCIIKYIQSDFSPIYSDYAYIISTDNDGDMVIAMTLRGDSVLLMRDAEIKKDYPNYAKIYKSLGDVRALAMLLTGAAVHQELLQSIREMTDELCALKAKSASIDKQIKALESHIAYILNNFQSTK